MKTKRTLITTIVVILIFFVGFGIKNGYLDFDNVKNMNPEEITEAITNKGKDVVKELVSADEDLIFTTPVEGRNIPKYSGEDYVKSNNNVPLFSDELKEYAKENSFEYYTPLDDLDRCGMTIANIGKEIMPTEERGEIGMVKPSGWNQKKYDFVDGKYIYNRCHLIGYQLAGENANVCNLITGTRYFNTQIMLPFENMVADYVKETGNHVLYRVTPMFEGDNLVATGVYMEAWSVEDNGEGVCFNVFCFNIEPGVYIDYATGENYEK